VVIRPERGSPRGSGGGFEASRQSVECVVDQCREVAFSLEPSVERCAQGRGGDAGDEAELDRRRTNVGDALSEGVRHGVLPAQLSLEAS
jgi:hypothetical protein